MRAKLAVLTLAGFIVGMLAGGAIGVYLAQVTAPRTETTPAIYVFPQPTAPAPAQGKIALAKSFTSRGRL